MIIATVLSHFLVGLNPRIFCDISYKILNNGWLILGNLNWTIEEASAMLHSIRLWERRDSEIDIRRSLSHKCAKSEIFWSLVTIGETEEVSESFFICNNLLCFSLLNIYLLIALRRIKENLFRLFG